MKIAFSCTFLAIIKMKVPYTPHFLPLCFLSTLSISVSVCPIVYCWANPSTAHAVNLKYNRSWSKPPPILSAALEDIWAKRSHINVHTQQISGHNSDSFQPLNVSHWTTTQSEITWQGTCVLPKHELSPQITYFRCQPPGWGLFHAFVRAHSFWESMALYLFFRKW